MSYVVGVDLGTTNSLVGMVKDGQVVRFADSRGEELLPSAVGMDEEKRIVVGRAARNRRLLDPERTALSVKRSMGRDERLCVGNRQLSSPQISALILGALLDRAEVEMGERPSRAVITVPAYFKDAARQATRDAGALAGLEVERLVNEPTAAALCYRSGEEELVLVYDLGGGTFDVSILERDEDVLEVSASHGDTHLGGNDVDAALYDWVLGQLGDGAGSTVAADPRARTRVMEAVERAKIALSDREQVRIFDPFVAGEGPRAVSLDLTLGQATLAEVAAPFVERTLRCIDEALRDAAVTARDLDRVLLVGGSSRLPVVHEMVANHLDMPAFSDIDADKAIVNGAAMLAGRAMGAEIAEVLVDITPHTLAAGTICGDELAASALIPRGTVVPVERRDTFYTMVVDQDIVEVPVAQGEERLIAHNTPIGSVHIVDLPPSPAGSPVEVAFRLDLSGVLHVSATHLPSGLSAQARIADSPTRLTEHMRERQREELEGLDKSAPEETATASELALAKAMVARSDRALGRADVETDTEVTERVSEARQTLMDAIERRAKEVTELTDDLSDALLDLF